MKHNRQKLEKENLLDTEGRIASGRDTDVTPAALDGDPSLAEKYMTSSMAPPIAAVRGNFLLSTLTAASTIGLIHYTEIQLILMFM